MAQKLKSFQFIKKANSVHNNFYDYSKSIYTLSKNKLIIICPIHGEFSQTPNSHLQGKGCPKCANNQKDTNQFIQDAIEKRGSEKFDYSKVDYANSRKKVIITCKTHGDFLITPDNFLRGKSCPKCSNQYSPTTQEALEKLKSFHGIKYSYPNFSYKRRDQLIKINCPIHGIFEKKYYECFRENLCPKCQSKNTEKIIQESKLKFGENTFDYSKTVFSKNREKMIFICPKHGEFKQDFYTHFNSLYGCPKCANEGRSKNNLNSRQEMIDKFNKKFPNLYNYDKFVYNGIDEKSIFTCPKHGDWEQTVYHFLNGNGCPNCNNNSKGESTIRNFLIENNIEFIQQKRFSDCKFKQALPFDFYIPSKNLLVEFQGEQHYKPIDRFGGKSEFELVKKRDKIKKDYALKNNFNFLEIKFDEKIEEELQKWL